MQAARFTRQNGNNVRMRNMGDALQSELIAMEIRFPSLQAAGEDRLDEALFAWLYRARRDHPAYLRGLIAKMDVADRPWLATMVCRNVVARMNAPRIKRRLDSLEKAAEEGKIVIPPKRD